MELLPNLRDKKISLASASPRRRELMGLLGIDFAVAPSVEVNEVYPDSLPAEEVPLFLSRLKAEGYRSIMTPDDLFITADTVVIIDGDVIGKPHDEADAAAMLGRLSGRRHTVVTGVTLSTLDRMESFSVATSVDFAPLTAEEIAFYVSRFRPLDKAGAYGIQEWIGAIGIKGIEGSFYNVMGLPFPRLWNALRSF